MNRLHHGIVLLLPLLAATAGGCAICANPDDEAYSAYGGMVERADPYHGRVNSAFGPGGGLGGSVLVEPASHEAAEEVGPGAPMPAQMPPASPEEREAGPDDDSPETVAPAAPEVFFE
jgi:hypothetical protein